jgi:hypothetical protein
VKEKLKIKFSTKGKATIAGKLLCHTAKNTLLKEIKIKIYRTLQTGPNRKEGGAQEGLMSVEYQLYELFILLLYHFT